ncbi:MAG: xylulose kinase [Anaerolineae bacterium]|nr:xylulose kinase [Anaerolineae bacterium]NIN99865.1 xylulose kinase [Anaerolineae bacterium]NIQ82642.1 xylulose kinase [Anaerolineae bacterium]
MSKTYLIGVDLGTMGTKAAIFDTDGNLVSQAFEESKLLYPKPGWVEQDPDDFYFSSLRTIKDCLESSGVEPRQVAALAFDGQMAGIGTIDTQWQTPTVYDSWLDTRCAPHIERMSEHQDLIIENSGGPPTYCHGPKIMWWRDEEPEVFSRIHKFVVPGGYTAGRMAGLAGDDAFIDYTYLHFSCLSDVKEAKWSEELCQLFSVPTEKLPRIVKPWEVIGQLTTEAAEGCGLLEGTPIAAGCGDQAAGMLGAAMVEPGMVFDVAGTASVFSICLDQFTADLEHKTLFTARLVPEDLWYALAYINGGGLNLRWFRDELAKQEKAEAAQKDESVYALLDEAAAALRPGSDSLLSLPHLGGRVTPSDPDLRGLWLGFTWSHRKEHLYRSLLESVAYEYAYYLDIEKSLLPDLEFKEARVIGGGSRSDLWNQIKADVLGIPYVQLNREEYAVLGSAIIAGYAVGVFDELKATAKRFVEPISHVEPRSEYHAHYRPLVDLYISLFDTLRPIYQKLARLPAPPEM